MLIWQPNIDFTHLPVAHRNSHLTLHSLLNSNCFPILIRTDLINKAMEHHHIQPYMLEPNSPGGVKYWWSTRSRYNTLTFPLKLHKAAASQSSTFIHLCTWTKASVCVVWFTSHCITIKNMKFIHVRMWCLWTNYYASLSRNTQQSHHRSPILVVDHMANCKAKLYQWDFFILEIL